MTKLYTLEEYLELDKHSDERFEYFDGEVFSMSGGSVNHERIVRNLIRRLAEITMSDTLMTLRQSCFVR